MCRAFRVDGESFHKQNPCKCFLTNAIFLFLFIKKDILAIRMQLSAFNYFNTAHKNHNLCVLNVFFLFFHKNILLYILYYCPNNNNHKTYNQTTFFRCSTSVNVVVVVVVGYCWCFFLLLFHCSIY